MPVYEYRCRKCGARFEVVRSLAEHESSARPKCPKCEATDTQAVISPVFAKTAKKS